MFTGKPSRVPLSTLIQHLQISLWKMLQSISFMIQAFSEREKTPMNDFIVTRYEYQTMKIIHMVSKMKNLIHQKKELMIHFYPTIQREQEMDMVERIEAIVEAIINLINAREFLNLSYKEQILLDLKSMLGNVPKSKNTVVNSIDDIGKLIDQIELVSPVEQIELTTPIDQIELTNPIEQIEPTNPIDKTELTNPIDKIELTNPIDKTELTNPKVQTELTNPIDQIELINPMEQIELINPIEQIELINPIEQIEPNNTYTFTYEDLDIMENDSKSINENSNIITRAVRRKMAPSPPWIAKGISKGRYKPKM